MILERKIPIGYILGKIKIDLLVVVVFSTATSLLSSYLQDLNIPVTIGAFLGTAIALILSFKLSQSYDRWWEARKIWGAIVNDSRTFVLQLKHFSKNPESALISRMAYRQMSWCYALGANLRGLKINTEEDPFLEELERQLLKDRIHIPLALLDNHSADLNTLHREDQLNDFQQVQIDSTLLRLCASMGKAERIKNTSFPKTYRLTLHLFIYIFLVMLSFSLTELTGFIEIPLLVFISVPFFLLEKIALNIQDPFENRPTDTAMTSIARTIERNIRELLKEEDIPEPLKPEKFYMQ
ncbi:bestrophin family protein [Poritiphilus flavus]|uniref:Hydrogenase n=1 Tax=Poritiphilus flavus TaxID=2697053 RepID=A0A6L9EHC6_9FLAO|nr:bestrophin family ion channel [Poritiphilus flavus]NAS14111.1 hypothetical protein [Poritiphilus flavus]